MTDANLEQSVNSALGLYNGNMNTITIPSEFIEYTRKHSVFHQEALKKYEELTAANTDEKLKKQYCIQLVEKLQASQLDYFRRNEEQRLNNLQNSIDTLRASANQIQQSKVQTAERIASLNNQYQKYKNSSEQEIESLRNVLRAI